MLGRIAGGFILLILMFAFSTNINNGIRNLRTDQVTKVETVVTGGGVTTGDITLTRELFGASLTHVISVTSTNDPTDVPLVSNYVDATKILTVSGLEASQTRSITLVYYSEKVDDFWSALGPFMGFLIFGGIIAAIVWSVWQGKKAGSYRGG